MANTLKFGNGQWATKEGSTLAYNSENNNYKPLPFTFDRDSVATRVNKQGLIETVGADQPRIDYLNDSNGALLLEPSRTNLVTYSEDFSQSSWVGGNVTRELNQIISPDGTLNATKLSATASFSQIQQSYTSVNDTDYTFSIFVKSPSSNVIGLRLASGTNDVRREFNLSTLSIQSMGGNNQELIDEGIIDFGSGWYRIFLTCKSDGTSSFLNIYPKNSSDATFQSVYVWGAMLEQGSYATSIINTKGSAVTRLADSCNNGGNEQVINSTEGVLYAEISALANDGTNRQISINNNGTSNRVYLEYSSVNNRIRGVVENSGGNQAILSAIVNDVKNYTKVAIKYKQNDFSLFINGFEVDTELNGGVLVGLSELSFDRGDGLSDFYGNVKDVRVYDTALTDQELAALTQV